MEYTDNRKVERVFDAPVDVMYQMFYDVVWHDGGGLGFKSMTHIVEQGDAETHVGEVRSVPLDICREKILKVEKNVFVEYTVLDESKLSPFAAHLGRVDFTPEDGGKKTRIVWSVKYTPKAMMSMATKPYIDGAFTYMLFTLDRQVGKRGKQ